MGDEQADHRGEIALRHRVDIAVDQLAPGADACLVQAMSGNLQHLGRRVDADELQVGTFAGERENIRPRANAHA